MGFLNRILITAFLCCAYYHHVNGQAAPSSDNCENRVFTNEDAVLNTKSDVKIGNQTIHRQPKNLAALECCRARNHNLHCSLICYFRAQKLLNADGSWNKINLIKTIIEDWKMESGPELVIRIFSCIDKYGPYKPTSTCHDIQKHYACFQDQFLQLNPGQFTSFFINSYKLEKSAWKCGNRTYHTAEPYLELARDCLANATSVYQRIRCQWKSFGMLDDNFDLSMASIHTFFKWIFGRRGPEIVDHMASRLKQYDVGKLWRDSVQQPENAISILSDYIADVKESLYESCGSRTDDFINSV